MIARALVLSCLVVGCGGAVRDEGATDAAAETMTDVTIDAGDPIPYCPPSPPTEGAACAEQAYHTCRYGDSPLPDCRSTFRCEGDDGEPRWRRWREGCVAPPHDCPAARPDDGAECAAGSASFGCAYDAALCWCVPSDAGTAWSCVTPSPGCPALVPNEGTTCTGERSCSYAVASGRWCIRGADAYCGEGVWHWTTGCAE